MFFKRFPVGSRVVVPYGIGHQAGVVIGYRWRAETVVKLDVGPIAIKPNKKVAFIQDGNPA